MKISNSFPKELVINGLKVSLNIVHEYCEDNGHWYGYRDCSIEEVVDNEVFSKWILDNDLRSLWELVEGELDEIFDWENLEKEFKELEKGEPIEKI